MHDWVSVWNQNKGKKERCEEEEKQRTFFPGFPSNVPTILSFTPTTLSNKLGSRLFTVLGAFFFVAAAVAVDVFFVLGAAAAFFFVTRPVAVLSAAAAVFRARGLEVLALVSPVALAAADLIFLLAVVAALLFFFVVAGRDCSGAAAGTKGTRGAVMPLLPRVAAGMVVGGGEECLGRC